MFLINVESFEIGGDGRRQFVAARSVTFGPNSGQPDEARAHSSQVWTC